MDWVWRHYPAQNENVSKTVGVGVSPYQLADVSSQYFGVKDFGSLYKVHLPGELLIRLPKSPPFFEMILADFLFAYGVTPQPGEELEDGLSKPEQLPFGHKNTLIRVCWDASRPNKGNKFSPLKGGQFRCEWIAGRQTPDRRWHTGYRQFDPFLLGR